MKVAATILKPFIFIIIIAIGVAILAFWVAAIIAIVFGHSYGQFFTGDQPWVLGLIYFLAFLLISIPLLSMGMAFWSLIRTRSLGTVRLKRKLGWIWVASLIGIVSVGSLFIRDFSGQGQSQQSFNLSDIPEIIELNFIQPDLKKETFLLDAGEFTMAGNSFISKNIHSEFYPAKDAPMIQQINFSRGRDNSLAKSRAENIGYNFTGSANVWDIPKFFEIPTGDQWRGQKVNLNIHLPIGQKVKISSDQRRNLHGIQFGDCASENTFYFLEMTSEGFKCIANS